MATYNMTVVTAIWAKDANGYNKPTQVKHHPITVNARGNLSAMHKAEAQVMQQISTPRALWATCLPGANLSHMPETV